MKYTLLPATFILGLTVLFCPPFALTYVGIVYCFLLSSLGASLGIQTIAKHVSGTSIIYPHIGTKSILGTVVCEANFLTGIISCILCFNNVRNASLLSARVHYIYFCSSVFVGICSFVSSLSTGMICAVVSLMDGKDELLFFKIVVLEVMPASVGLVGFILGIIMNSKV